MDKAALRRDPIRGAPRRSCPGACQCLLWDVRRRVPLFFRHRFPPGKEQPFAAERNATVQPCPKNTSPRPQAPTPRRHFRRACPKYFPHSPFLRGWKIQREKFSRIIATLQRGGSILLPPKEAGCSPYHAQPIPCRQSRDTRNGCVLSCLCATRAKTTSMTA